MIERASAYHSLSPTMMDIFNRPPSIAEDTLHYTIYPPPGSTDKAAATTFAACIQELVDQLLPDYFLWHRDPFEVKVVARSPEAVGLINRARDEVN